MIRRLLSPLVVLGAVAALGLAACGGGDESTATTSSDPPRSLDIELPQQADIGLRQAFATFTENGDETTAVIEMSVERTEENLDLTYATAIHAGTCDALGDVERSLGDLPMGSNTLSIDAPYDEVVGSLEAGEASVVIMAPDGSKVAWCGPGLA